MSYINTVFLKERSEFVADIEGDNIYIYKLAPYAWDVIPIWHFKNLFDKAQELNISIFLQLKENKITLNFYKNEKN